MAPPQIRHPKPTVVVEVNLVNSHTGSTIETYLVADVAPELAATLFDKACTILKDTRIQGTTL